MTVLVEDLLRQSPFREIPSVIIVTHHDPRVVWVEMDEYVPTERIQRHFADIVDSLADTRRGATERSCVWVSGFFGSGKSHFLKVLGYLLEDHELEDPDGGKHSSTSFLCRKLALDNVRSLLADEFRTRVLFLNLLDHDPQSPDRPTITRLVYRSLLQQQGLSTEFWVAEREKELRKLGKWQEFLTWVQERYGRSWEHERKLNAEAVLRRALPAIRPELYENEEVAARQIDNNKRESSSVSPSHVVSALREEAESLDEHNGRVIVLLDEVGLYVGDSVDRLTNLNRLAEQVVEQGGGKVMMIATAQETLPDLVARLTSDRQILEWLRDRFRLRCGLEPTEVQSVISRRLLEKTTEGARYLQQMYETHQGALLANLSIDRSWNDREFVELYPFAPYSVGLVQDIMGAMRGSIEDARRLSGSERSMLKLTHAILTGEGEIVTGARQDAGWLVSLDRFYDALAPDLNFISSQHVSAIRDLERDEEHNGLALGRVAKALYLLQHVQRRYPCTLDNLASSLVERVDADLGVVREAVQQAMKNLRDKGWAVEDEGQYRLLTPIEHDLERDVRANHPTPSEVNRAAIGVVRDMLTQFRYEHGRIRRPMRIALEVDGEPVQEEGELAAELFTPLAEDTEDDVIGRSVSWPHTLFWIASKETPLKQPLERTIAVEKTLEQWRTRSLSPEQAEHRGRLEREAQSARQMKLPQLMRQAFLGGVCFRGGQRLSPSEADMASVLRKQFAAIAGVLFTEFIDDRPERDDDSAAILTWRPGTVLPEIYGRLQLLTTGNQLNRDVSSLATVLAEVKRRDQVGLDRAGRDFLEAFQKKPYGWDPRLLRTLFASLYEAGVIGVSFQNRALTDPTGSQARTVFANARDFGRAIFSVLPEVDWRRASTASSTIFGVQGGDTFERTAAIVQEQAGRWTQEARTLSTRCRDNGLHPSLTSTCSRIEQTLGELTQNGDPSARLRQLLDQAEELEDQLSLLRSLAQFPFDRYRHLRSFVQSLADWGTALSGDAAERWQRLRTDAASADVPERWSGIWEDYGFLLTRYRSDYAESHREFQTAVRDALQAAEAHEAVQDQLDPAAAALQPLRSLVCDSPGGEPADDTHRCSVCLRAFGALSPAVAIDTARRVDAALDALLPKPPSEEVGPFSLRRTIADEAELDSMADELRRYTRRAPAPIDVRIHAEPTKEA